MLSKISIILTMSAEAPYIICDSNHAENGVHDRLVALAGPVAVRRQRLDVGDFVVVAGSTRIIIERKSSADLAASLQDGRCREQKTRQMAAVAQDSEGKTRVVWLIEGQLSGWHASMPPPRCFPVKQIETALVCTAVRDGIPVLRAKDQVGAPPPRPPPSDSCRTFDDTFSPSGICR
jgi:ERCC4-type nuclease